MKKIAVVMFNLGGPDSREAIEPFLMNFFMDWNIIRLPLPFRYMLAKLISKRRSKREAGDSYEMLKNKSPLLANSQAQADALDKILAGGAAEFKTFICMRYWHPMADDVAVQVKDWGADEIVLLPLYPQFSTTTTRSSMQTWVRAMKRAGFERPVSGICCYPLNEGFIQASVENIQEQIELAKKSGHENFRVLFSAHGLPESVIIDGDPYQWQCEQTAAKIAERLGVEDWAICYQSRVGPKKWISPALEKELERAAKDGKSVIIYPHSFTQEHVETLVELDVEYRHKADEMKIDGYYRAKTVSTHPAFIEGLKEMVLEHLHTQKITGEGGPCVCPDQFNRCCMCEIESV